MCIEIIFYFFHPGICSACISNRSVFKLILRWATTFIPNPAVAGAIRSCPTFSETPEQLNSYSTETLQPANITFVAQKFLSAKVRFIQYKQFVKITGFYIYKIL